MTKWEYLTAPVLVHATKQILDNFGADGWELVQIVPGLNPENLVAYFKRPVARRSTSRNRLDDPADRGTGCLLCAGGSQRQLRLHLGPVAFR